jgi:hypothetical protein
MASTTERVRVKLPAGFDPDKHTKALQTKITEINGPGFKIDSIEDGYAVTVRAAGEDTKASESQVK